MRYILIILLSSIALNLIGCGIIDIIDSKEKKNIISTLQKADKVTIYDFWSANIENDYIHKDPNTIISDKETISSIINSISFKMVPITECGFTYSLIFYNNGIDIFKSPLRINCNYSNISFSWKEKYYVCGMKRKKELELLLRTITNK